MLLYRGVKNLKHLKGKKGIGVWCSGNKYFALEYGKLITLKAIKKLNLLDCTSEDANILANKFMGNEENEDSFATDIWYEPIKKFILFLKRKGFNGFINEDNILIFDFKHVKVIL